MSDTNWKGEPINCELCYGTSYIDLGPCLKECLCERVDALEKALDQAIVDLNGVAYDDPFVRKVAVPRAQAVLKGEVPNV